MVDTAVLRAQDLLPVRSRVSWGAIFAGAVVALALYFLLSLLGSALGLSVSGQVQADQLGIGAAVWAVAVTLLSLFTGGWVTTQCVVGESKAEAVLSGVIVWAVALAILLGLAAASVRVGFSALIWLASIHSPYQDAAGVASPADMERAAEKAGLSKEQLDRLRAAIPTSPQELRRVAEDPEMRQAAVRTTWWVFAGTVLSLFARTAGALVGAGPMPVLLRSVAMRVSRTTTHTPHPANKY